MRQPTTLGDEKARSLYIATKSFQFADIPLLDITDRISLMSVAAGLRPVGMLEAEGLEETQIRDALVNHGLFTWKGKTSDGRAALWFAGDEESRKQLKGKAQTDEGIGQLMSYPECCTKGNDERNRALEENPNDGRNILKNVPLSGEKFPYVSHVACDACLESSNSPSAILNASNETLAKNIDSEFADLVSTIAEEVPAIKDEAHRDEAIRKIDAMHRAFFK